MSDTTEKIMCESCGDERGTADFCLDCGKAHMTCPKCYSEIKSVFGYMEDVDWTDQKKLLLEEHYKKHFTRSVLTKCPTKGIVREIRAAKVLQGES